MFSKHEITEMRARFSELRGLDDTSIDETLIRDIEFNRSEATRKAATELKKAAAKAAYDAEMARYLAKNMNGKNGRKTALRAARAIFAGFGY